jgi:hypothetical protein
MLQVLSVLAAVSSSRDSDIISDPSNTLGGGGGGRLNVGGGGWENMLKAVCIEDAQQAQRGTDSEKYPLQ